MDLPSSRLNENDSFQSFWIMFQPLFKVLLEALMWDRVEIPPTSTPVTPG